jgi:hypothetical protein
VGLKGLSRLAAALTILLTDYGGTTTRDTCQTIAELVPIYKTRLERSGC